MKPLKTSALLLFTFLFIGCRNDNSKDSSSNSIYYWRTTLSLSESECSFLDRHDVKKIYLRFFDVERDWDAPKVEEVVPNATVIFNDSLPEGLEIVPTVYITTSAIEKIQRKEDEYAEKLLRRVDAICRQNGIYYTELQLDCDWTKGTRETFFNLCKSVKTNMDSTRLLSSTIRLHQLIQPPPPVDKGVLMVYNTGNLMELTTENSIFSRKDIEPYLQDDRLEKYTLPLDIAYPAYGWSIVYYPGVDKYYFYKLMRQTDFSKTPGLKKIGDNMYEVVEDFNSNPEERTFNDINKGYRIRVERPTASKILEVKELIDSHLKHKSHSNILYHLDESQLSHYTNNEIDKIYHRN